MRRLAFAFVTVMVLVLTQVGASASWSPSSSGAGYSAGLWIGPATTTVATETGSTSIHITWVAPSGASATPTQYVVRRTAPSTATVCTVSGSTFACDDTSLSASTLYTYTVEARIGTNWSSGQTSGFSATTSAPPDFIVSVTAGNKTAGTAFTATITATTDGVTTDTSYSGSKTVTFTGPADSDSGQAPLYPGSVSFTSGVGSASIKLYNAATATLTATAGALTGSTSITVVAGAPSKLGYTNSSPTCASGSVHVGNGGSFVSKVTMFDAYLNPATQGTSRSVSLTKSVGTGSLSPTTLTIGIGSSETSGSFTIAIPTGNPPNRTVTAASSGITSVVCTVKK